MPITKTNFRNWLEESIESAAVAFTLEQPAFGQVRVSNGLRKPVVLMEVTSLIATRFEYRN